MMEKICIKLTSCLCAGADYSEKEKAKVQYGLSILLSEGLKMIFLILLFTFLQQEKYFYFSLLILLSTRVFAGGIHVKGTLNCLMLTTLLFICTSVLAPQVPKLPAICYLLTGSACIAAVLIRAPVCSIQRPIKDQKTRAHYRLAATLFTVFWAAALLFIKRTPFINCGFSTLLLQSTQLVLAKQPK